MSALLTRGATWRESASTRRVQFRSRGTMRGDVLPLCELHHHDWRRTLAVRLRTWRRNP